MVNSRCVCVCVGVCESPEAAAQRAAAHLWDPLTRSLRLSSRLENRDVLWEDRKGGRDGEARALKEIRRDRVRKGIIPLPLHAHRRQKKPIARGDNKRQEQEEEGKQVVSSVRQRVRNISAGSGSGVETARAAAPLCGSQSVVRIQQKSTGEVGGWFQVIPGKNMEY